MKRDLGKAGENKFASWCSDVGITINKAEEDRHGWDYLLELPVNRATGSAFDLHKSNMICKVQVKATEGKKLSKSVELSNLHSLATDPLPVFYLFLHFNNNANPVAAYLLHLDENHIRRILKLAREHISAGDGKRLHKKSLTLSYDDNHRLPEASGHGLLEHLREKYYPRWGSLLSAKQEVLNTAGFEDGAGTIQFTIDGADQRENLILSSLGYTKKISVSNFSFWNKRFGIKDPNPLVSMADAVMTMTPTGSIETRVMITSPTAETLIMPAKVYFSPFINNLDKAVFRISTDFIDIRADAGTKNIQLNSTITDEKPYPLNLLRKALIFFEKTLTTQSQLSVYFEYQGNFLHIFSAHSNGIKKPIERLSAAADCLHDVLKDSFDPSALTVTLDWLRNNWRTAKNILDLKKGSGNFKVKFRKNEDIDTAIPERAHFFHYKILDLDSISYIFIFTAQCSVLHNDDGGYSFGGELKLVKETEGPNTESWKDEVLIYEGTRLAEELVAVGDMYCEDYWTELSRPPLALMVRSG